MPPLTALLPAPSPPPGSPALVRVVRVVPWDDPLVEATGVDPRSTYVELFWLPVLGPSATWLVRRFADLFDLSPVGAEVDLGELARSLGVGGIDSRHAPLRRAVRRCARFGMLRPEGPARLAVRRLLGPLPRHHVAQLPDELQLRHRRWEEPHTGAEASRRRARLLALDELALGGAPATVERRLLGCGVHPALAHETARWAVDRVRCCSPAEPGSTGDGGAYVAGPGRR